MVSCFKPIWQGYLLMKKKIAAVATSGNKWLWRERFYISSVVTCMDVMVGCEKYSQECGQCFPWALFSLQRWSSLTWENQRRDRKWLYWDDSFAKRGCVPAMAFQEVPVLGLWALFLTTVQVCAFSPAPPFSSSGCIHLEGWPSSELYHRVELMPSPSPFVFSTLFFPTSSALCCYLWCSQCPHCGWGFLCWGRDILQGSQDFLCLRVDVWSTGYFICLWI